MSRIFRFFRLAFDMCIVFWDNYRSRNKTKDTVIEITASAESSHVELILIISHLFPVEYHSIRNPT